MLYQIFALTVKDLKILFRDRAGIITLFAMPIMFILVMSVALQSAFQVGGGDRPVEILVVNEDAGATYINGEKVYLAADAMAALNRAEGLRLVETWKRKPLTRQQAEALIADGEYRLALAFPPDFSRRVVDAVTTGEGEPATVTMIVDPAAGIQLTAPVKAAAMALLNRTVAYAQAPYRIETALMAATTDMPPQPAPPVAQMREALTAQLLATYDLGDIGGRSEVRLKEITPAAFQAEELPDAVEQSVPGYTVFGVFFILGVLASSILNEKEVGTFRRLMVAPLPRAALLLGKLAPYYLVNLIQVGLMFAIGRLVFGMSLGHDPLALVVVTLAAAAAATGLGLLVATLGKTQRQIGGISTLLALTLAAVGGMMVPVFVMPDFMQIVARISPHYWALQGYQDVIVRGQGVGSVLPEAGVLLGFALAFYGMAVARFRFE